MVASASIGVAEHESGNAFFYFERQLAVRGDGPGRGAGRDGHPDQRLGEAFDVPAGRRLRAAGAGADARASATRSTAAAAGCGSGFMNFQVSELARVMLLTYVASYAVRRSDELRASFKGFMKPVGGAGRRGRAAARRAGLRRRDGADGHRPRACCSSPARACATCSCRSSSASRGMAAARGHLVRTACAALTAFLDPWDDPFDSGFQLTQSLIAIGRGEWFGVGLGASVQKLFYLPEAHTDFVFAVLAEELGFVGVLRRRSGCSRCWSAARSRSRARPRDAGLHVPVLPRGRRSASGSACRRS